MRYFILIILLAGISWIAIDRSSINSDHQSTDTKLEADSLEVKGEEKPSIQISQKSNVVSTKTSASDGLVENHEGRITLNSLCSFDVDDSFFAKFNPDRIANFTDKQNQLFEHLKSNCFEWYEYLVDNPSVKSMFEEQNQRMALVEAQVLENVRKGISYSEEVQQAKQSLRGEGILPRRTALAMLARADFELRELIAADIGTEKETYIIQSARDFFQVYYCGVDPSECAADGTRMVLECLYDERACGIDLITYMSLQRSPNEFADILAMADSFGRIIGSGYPH